MRQAALSLCVGFSALAGCQSVSDKAAAEALEACSNKPDLEARIRCRDEIFAAADASERKRLEDQRSRLLEQEQREALREAQGLPKRAH